MVLLHQAFLASMLQLARLAVHLGPTRPNVAFVVVEDDLVAKDDLAPLDGLGGSLDAASLLGAVSMLEPYSSCWLPIIHRVDL